MALAQIFQGKCWARKKSSIFNGTQAAQHRRWHNGLAEGHQVAASGSGRWLGHYATRASVFGTNQSSSASLKYLFMGEKKLCHSSRRPNTVLAPNTSNFSKQCSRVCHEHLNIQNWKATTKQGIQIPPTPFGVRHHSIARNWSTGGLSCAIKSLRQYFQRKPLHRLRDIVSGSNPMRCEIIFTCIYKENLQYVVQVKRTCMYKGISTSWLANQVGNFT